MKELEKIVKRLNEKPFSISELAASTGVTIETCKSHIKVLKDLGLAYETRFEDREQVHLRRFPEGPRIWFLSPLRAPDDIEVLPNVRRPKPEDIIDLT